MKTVATTLVRCFVLAAFALVTTASYATILGIQSNASVYNIDETTAVPTLLRTNPTFAANAMARNSSGVYYTAGGLGNSRLNTINPTSGLISAGPTLTPNDDVRGLAFSPADVLYATSNTGGIAASLYTIDVVTGVATLIAPVGPMQGLTFSGTGTLYGWSSINGLVTINPVSGAVTDVNPGIGSTAAIQTLAFSGAGVLFAASETDLYTVDLTTGALSLVGSLAPVNTLRGMEFTTTLPPAPGVALTPTPLAFGNQVVSTTSAAQALTLQNIGSATLNITSIAAAGDFAQTNSCGATLAPSATCTINVTFTPTVLGVRNGTITVTSNAASSPNTVPLTGTGVAAPSGPVASLTPPSLVFGSQLVGTTSAAQALTLQNTGGTVLTIGSIAASGDFAQTNNCAASLATAASCTITVTFTPTLVGARTGAVTVTSNAAGSPNSAALNGVGAAVPPPPVPGAAIPTLSQWGLIVLVLLLGLLAFRHGRTSFRR